MAADCRYELSQAAYIKLVLHSLKHQTSSVNGLLLGRLREDSPTAIVQIDDAVPLSHSHIGLLPTLELALIQVEEHFGAVGMSIVGYYHANERHDDAELSNAAKKIGDHIFRWTIRSSRGCPNRRHEILLFSYTRGIPPRVGVKLDLMGTVS